MNDADLDKLLKEVGLPVRSADYWEQFPRRVASRLRRAPAIGPARPRWLARFAWGLAGAAACLIIGFLIGQGTGGPGSAARDNLLQNKKLIFEMTAMFPNRVRAILQDERGNLSLVLSEHDDVPASSPLFVRICQGEQCSSALTFSGQEIQIAGQKVTVLSDTWGGVILVGERFVWSGGKSHGAGDLRIEAKVLAEVRGENRVQL